MYLVSVSAEEYLLIVNFNSVETTQSEDKALHIDKIDIQQTLNSLRRMGYEPLLIRTDINNEMAMDKN